MKIVLIILLVVLTVLQYRFWFANDGLLRVFRLKREISSLQKKNDAITKHNEDLVNEIIILKKGGDAIENRARNDLGMVKKGEVFYQIIR